MYCWWQDYGWFLFFLVCSFFLLFALPRASFTKCCSTDRYGKNGWPSLACPWTWGNMSFRNIKHNINMSAIVFHGWFYQVESFYCEKILSNPFSTSVIIIWSLCYVLPIWFIMLVAFQVLNLPCTWGKPQLVMDVCIISSACWYNHLRIFCSGLPSLFMRGLICSFYSSYLWLALLST